MKTTSEMIFSALKLKKQHEDKEIKSKIEKIQSVFGDWHSSKMESRNDSANKASA